MRAPTNPNPDFSWGHASQDANNLSVGSDPEIDNMAPVYQDAVKTMLAASHPVATNTERQKAARKVLSSLKAALAFAEEEETQATAAVNEELIEADNGAHVRFGPKGEPMVGPELERAAVAMKMTPEVVGKALEVFTGLLVKGCGEKQLAFGCFVVLTNDRDRFLRRVGGNQGTFWDPAELGHPPLYNKHALGNKLNVLHMSGAAMRYLQPDLVATGGIIVMDAITGEFTASRVEARKGMQVDEGTYDGVDVVTLDDREAAAIASKGGCLVMTCPPENCEISGNSVSVRVCVGGWEGGCGVSI